MTFSDPRRRQQESFTLKGLDDYLERVKKNISFFLKGFFSHSTDVLEAELKETESAFCTILFGSLVGIPSPAPFIGIKMLPLMEREIMVMISRSGSIDDRMAEWFSIFDFG